MFYFEKIFNNFYETFSYFDNDRYERKTPNMIASMGQRLMSKELRHFIFE